MKKILISGLVALSVVMSSCDHYLDINDSPNSPSESAISEDLIFPGAEMCFVDCYSDFLRIPSGYFAQYYAQTFGTSNYLDYSKFKQSSTLSSRMFTTMSAGALQNMSTVIAKAKATGSNGTVLAATVIRAAAYQALIDCYGEIPYSEALDPNNPTPKYDDGADVYAGILRELDEAIAACNGTEKVCTNFLIPGARSGEWIKLANAIKLRILMRESGAVDVKPQLDALVTEDNFPAGDVAWEGCWTNESGHANPFYQEEFATYFGSTQTNVVLNLALFAAMNVADDARLTAWFTPNTDKGEYTGAVSGTNFQTTSSYKSGYWCRPNVKFDDPVVLISRAEVDFFLAEYQARYGTAAKAEEHYKAAIEASFASAGVAGADKVLQAYPYDNADYARCIGVQKWIALSGVNTFEGYCELRRLGYPTFGNVTGSQIYNELNDTYNPALLVAGELYTPILVNPDLGDNKVLQRWPYPESSANRNGKTPAFKGYTTPIFWAE